MKPIYDIVKSSDSLDCFLYLDDDLKISFAKYLCLPDKYGDLSEMIVNFQLPYFNFKHEDDIDYTLAENLVMKQTAVNDGHAEVRLLANDLGMPYIIGEYPINHWIHIFNVDGGADDVEKALVRNTILNDKEQFLIKDDKFIAGKYAGKTLDEIFKVDLSYLVRLSRIYPDNFEHAAQYDYLYHISSRVKHYLSENGYRYPEPPIVEYGSSMKLKLKLIDTRLYKYPDSELGLKQICQTDDGRIIPLYLHNLNKNLVWRIGDEKIVDLRPNNTVDRYGHLEFQANRNMIYELDNINSQNKNQLSLF